MARGRKQRSQSQSAQAQPAVTLPERELAVLNAIPSGGGEARSIHLPGLSPQARTRALVELERRGLVERYPNGHGPEQPWWWMRLPKAPDDYESPAAVEKGTIYDRYEPNGRPVVFIELTGEINEYGCVRCHLKAGGNNGRMTWVPAHLLESFRMWIRRREESPTAYSLQFRCPVHGENLPESWITTAKNCAKCGSGLIRL
jgi:hypothetical protein